MNKISSIELNDLGRDIFFHVLNCAEINLKFICKIKQVCKQWQEWVLFFLKQEQWACSLLGKSGFQQEMLECFKCRFNFDCRDILVYLLNAEKIEVKDVSRVLTDISRSYLHASCQDALMGIGRGNPITQLAWLISLVILPSSVADMRDWESACVIRAIRGNREQEFSKIYIHSLAFLSLRSQMLNHCHFRINLNFFRPHYLSPSCASQLIKCAQFSYTEYFEGDEEKPLKEVSCRILLDTEWLIASFVDTQVIERFGKEVDGKLCTTFRGASLSANAFHAIRKDFIFARSFRRFELSPGCLCGKEIS